MSRASMSVKNVMKNLSKVKNLSFLLIAKLVIAKVNGFKAKPLTDHKEYKELYNGRRRASI